MSTNNIIHIFIIIEYLTQFIFVFNITTSHDNYYSVVPSSLKHLK
jgi:hypothetical protein